MKQIFSIALFSIFCVSCKKDHQTPLQQDAFVTIDNVVFNPKSSNDLKNHIFNIDTLHYSPYTLDGFGVFAGKSRNINFSPTRYKGLPVIEVSGWDDFGYTTIVKDTSGRIMELYRKKIRFLADPDSISDYCFRSEGTNNRQQLEFNCWLETGS